MVRAANQESYGNPAWGAPPQGAAAYGAPPWSNQGWNAQPQPPAWGPQGWNGAPFWHPAGVSRPVVITAMVLGFIFWWPVGLAILISMVWSGRMGCWGRRARAAFDGNGQAQSGGNTQCNPMNAWRAWTGGAWTGGDRHASTSGNRAFDEYRSETIRRLEDEQKEFGAFLERLRFAKDKGEFDQFMDERRQRPATPPAAPEPPFKVDPGTSGLA